MASSGKKGKKSKGKTVTLTDFLQETPGVPTLPVKKYNWSDEVEDAFDGFESRPKPQVALPTAPRAARGPDISDDKIPTQPPYIAYISNLPYDIEEEDIAMFFSNMNISNMRLPRGDRGEGSKLKGFGYVEFEDRDSLVEAISIIDTNLKGRRIKIDVAANSDNDRRRGGRMEMGRDRPERPEVTMSDWRSGPRDTPTESRDNRDRGGFRDRGGEREGREESNRPGAWRDGSERPSFRDDDRRDRGGFRDSERSGGGFRDSERGGGGFRDSERGGGGFRDSDRDRGGFRDSERSGGGFRDSDRGSFRDSDRDRGGGGGFRDSDRDRGRYGGDRDREERRGFGPRRDYNRDDRDRDFKREEGPPADKDQPRNRPKLNLIPRTKPLEEKEKTEVAEAAPAPAPAVPAASIFGSAKPVDTAARERQIEERLAKEKEEKKSLPARDGSRDKNRESDDDRGSKKDWARKRNDSHEDKSPERRPSSRGPRRNDDRRIEKNDDKRSERRDEDRKDDRKNDRKDDRKDRDKAPVKRDEKPKERPPRENQEKEMPKLKEPEPPNFAASNKFATLEADDDLSD